MFCKVMKSRATNGPWMQNCYNFLMGQGRENLFSKLRHRVFFIAASVLLLACSSELTDKQTRADLQKWFEGNWPGAILITEYATTNKDLVNGKFVIEYRAKGRFIRDTEGCVLTCCGPVCIDKRVDGLRWLTKASNNPQVIREGDLFETQGRKTYIKTIRGWQREEP